MPIHYKGCNRAYICQQFIHRWFMVKQSPKGCRVIRAGAEVKPCREILEVDSVNLKAIACLAAGGVITGILVNIDTGDSPKLSKGTPGQQDCLPSGLAGRGYGVLKSCVISLELLCPQPVNETVIQSMSTAVRSGRAEMAFRLPT